MSTTDYSGIFNYTDNHLDYILTSEGRLKWNDHDHLFYAEYFIKDHLGNVRSIISSDPNQHIFVQGTDYYPFGMEIPEYGSSDNQLKYNSKELQTEAKLNWYDYGARFYDPALGRFYIPDPMSEDHQDYTTYHYCFNNPINLIDPLGMDTITAQQADVQPVKKGDVVIMEDGTESTMSADETQIKPDNKQDNSSDGSNARTGNIEIPLALPIFLRNTFLFNALNLLCQVGVILTIPGDTRIDRENDTYFPPPKILPGFPDAERVPNKGRARWRTKDGDILEWDYQHGEVEIYNRNGKHKGSKKPDGTNPKPVKPGRKPNK
jgi:RHS repeat-associated protein